LKITQDEVVDNQTTLHIELEDSDLDPYLDQGYRRISPQVSIPGFRRGKAPRRVIESYIGRDGLLNEVFDSMVFEVTDKAIKEQNLDAVGVPIIDAADMDPVQFSATIPLRPDIQLGGYRAIRIDYEEVVISEDDVSSRIDEIRQSLGSWEEVEREPRFGDLTSLDMHGVVDDEPVWNGEDISFYLDEEGSNPLPGFPEEIVGAEPNQQIDFTLEVPDDFRDASIAGKEASFSVTVKTVQERILPELNDEFAQGLPDGFENLEALRTQVEEVLTTDAKSRADSEYQDKVIETLLDGIDIDIPPVLLDQEVENSQAQQDQFLDRANILREDYLAAIGKTEEEALEEAEAEADRRIRRNFAIRRLADLEGVEVTTPEIDERFNQVFAGQRIRRRERRQRRESLEDMLKIEKTVDLLVSIAKGEHTTDNTNTESDQDSSVDSEALEAQDDTQT
jgi:trigger factor